MAGYILRCGLCVITLLLLSVTNSLAENTAEKEDILKSLDHYIHTRNDIELLQAHKHKTAGGDGVQVKTSTKDKELWKSCFKGYDSFYTHARGCGGTRLCRCYMDKACCINITVTIPELKAKIRELSCKNCFNGTLTMDAFRNISRLNLTRLDLSRSNILHIEVRAFSKLNNLRLLETLDFSTNFLTNIPQLCDGRNNFSGLNSLNFHKNELSRVDPGTFNCFDNLTHLNLGKNHITLFDIRMFVNLTKLSVLDLHYNWISTNNVSVLDGQMSSLKVLNLSKNEIGIWPPSLCNGSVGPFPNLENLNLAENIIMIPWNETWSCLKNLKLLNLTRNPIRFLLENTFSQLDSLEQLLLNDVFYSIDVFKETALNNSNMWMVTLSSNRIDFVKKVSFRNIFHHSSNLTELDLSGNNLKDLHKEVHNIVRPINKTLQYLHLNDCNLTAVPKSLTRTLPKLKNLSMTNNQISGFNNTDFKNAKKLEALNLTSNKIQKFDPKSLAGIVNGKLKIIDFSNNPLDCSCDDKNENKMREGIVEIGPYAYIGKAILHHWPNGYKCASPPGRLGVKLVDFNVEEECRETNWVQFIIIILASFVFLVTILLVIVHKYIWYIRYWIYKAKKRLRLRGQADPERRHLLDVADGMMKDVYIINHGNDDRFVMSDLRSIIEEQMGYSSCIYYRDCCVGPKVELMVESMYECANSIAVVSKSFIKDLWCKFQLDVAFDRRVKDKNRKLLLIIYDDIDFQVLNKYWCVMLTKTPKAQWCSEGAQNYDILSKLFKQDIENLLGPSRNRQNGH